MNLKVPFILALLLFHTLSGVVVTQIAPGLDRAVRTLTLGFDLLMFILALASLRSVGRVYPRRLLGIFLVAAAFTILYNLDSVTLLTQLNGLREPMFLFSSLIVLESVFVSDYAVTFERWTHLLLLTLAALQIPIALYQFRTFGANDAVGGSLGMGGSGVLTLTLFLLVFYFVARNGASADAEGFRIPRVMLFSFFLIPCALNETKISFVLAGAFIVLLLNARRLLSAAPLVVLGLVLLAFFNVYYTENVQDTSKLFDEKYLERYLFYDSRTSVDVPRFQKMGMMFDAMRQDWISGLLGMGYGLFLGSGEIESLRLKDLLTGFVGSRILLNTLWIQGGVLAVAVYALCSFGFLRQALRQVWRIRRLAMFLGVVVFGTWLYNNALLSRGFVMIAAFLMLWTFHGGPERVEDEAVEGRENPEEETDQHVTTASR